MTRIVSLAAIAVAFWAATALADIVVPGTEPPGGGSDGAFNPTANVEVDLSQAVETQWDRLSPNPGGGVYDPNKWAVVFKYSSVNIPAGVTVTFKNHPSRAPVVWLVSGNVTIAGTVSLNGQQGHDLNSAAYYASPGPGGFRGGVGRVGTRANSSGMGPGGRRVDENLNFWGGSFGISGQYASGRLYGHPALRALIGGSGGAGIRDNDRGGGGGGGAILIASTATISLQGSVIANGGNGGWDRFHWFVAVSGSGGAIRLVADTITGSGILRANGGIGDWYGGDGRIRVERNSGHLSDPGSPAFTEGLPGETAVIWPETTAPRIRVVAIGGQNVPADPRASLQFPQQDVTLSNPSATTIRLECQNVPLPPAWQVKVGIVPKTGAEIMVDASPVSGDQTASVWEAQVTLPNGFCAIQARASKR